MHAAARPLHCPPPCPAHWCHQTPFTTACSKVTCRGDEWEGGAGTCGAAKQRSGVCGGDGGGGWGGGGGEQRSR